MRKATSATTKLSRKEDLWAQIRAGRVFLIKLLSIRVSIPLDYRVPQHVFASSAVVDAGRRPALSGITGPATNPTFRAVRAARDTHRWLRLRDAMRRVEPTWIEGVAVVQAVCAQLDHGETPPAIGDIVLSEAGAVSFPLGGMSDVDVAIQAVGRLLTGFLRAGGGPLSAWEAVELTLHSPMFFGSVRGFGAALNCFPAHRGPRELAAYFKQSRDLGPAHTRTTARGGRIVADPPAFAW